MKRRNLQNNLSISELTFGTMRFEYDNDYEAEILLKKAIDLGVTSFHTSFEYKSHNYFKEIFAKVQSFFPSKHFQHIIKLGEPHFDSKYFDASRFEKIIDKQLLELKAERIDVVQWLLRHTPNEDKFRIKILEDSIFELSELVSKLKKKGKIALFGSHPYSIKFAEKVSSFSHLDIWITYLNLIEKEWIPLLDKPFIGIRPLAAGKLMKKNDIWKYIRENDFFYGRGKLESLCLYPLLHPNVKSLIISIRNLNNLDALDKVIDKSNIDLDTFNKVTTFLSNKEDIKLEEAID